VGPLAIHNGALIYPESKKKLKYYDLLTGDILGQYKAKGVPQTGLAVDDTLGFYGAGPRKNFIRAINLLAAKRLWQVLVKDALPGPIIVGNRLIVSSSEGSVWSLDLATGDPVWVYHSDRRLAASVSFADGTLFQPADQSELIALAADDGHELYRVTLDGPLVAGVVADDRVYAADMLGHVYALSRNDGTIEWQTSIGGPIWSTPAVSGDQIVVSQTGGELVALDKTSGIIQWRYATGSAVRATPLVIGDLVVAGTLTGKMLVLDRANGALVDSTTVKGAVEEAPVTDGRRVYVATQAGKIICFGESNEQADRPDHQTASQYRSERTGP
jgi:outer membrane protein assembly factor BamB